MVMNMVFSGEHITAPVTLNFHDYDEEVEKTK